MVHTNPKVFFDMEVHGTQRGRIVMELFADTVPIAAENFRSLCTGERGTGICGKPLHFKGSRIHQIIPEFMWCGGDFVNGDGSGGESIYGPVFPDENFIRRHDRPGILSMANNGPHSNGSQFQIAMRSHTLLDDTYVVFGQVVEGLDLIKKIESVVGIHDRIPSKPVIIADCGQIDESEGLVVDEYDELVVDEYEELVVDESEALGSVPTMKVMLHKLADELRTTHKKIAAFEKVLVEKDKARQIWV